jgi:hypothetical protein
VTRGESEVEGHLLVWDESTDDPCDDFSGETEDVVDGGYGDAPEPKDGMAVGMLFVLGFE